jgi:hypothetical protein
MWRIVLLLLALCGPATAQVGLPFPGPGGVAGPPPATWTIVGTASCQYTIGNSGCTTSPAISTLTANLFVISYIYFDSTFGYPPENNFTDSQFNPYNASVQGPSGENATGGSNHLIYFINPSTSATHTWTSTSVSGQVYGSLTVIAVKDSHGTPSLDASSAGACGSPSAQPGSITPSVSGSLVVSGDTYTDTSTLSVNSSMTIAKQVPVVSGIAYGGGIAYLSQTTAAAINPTWSSSTGSGMCATIMAFHP